MPRYPRGWPPLLQIAAVLAIIAFVSAVVFPVFQKVREPNHHGSCASNMNQLGLALTQYTQDSDEKLPSGGNKAGNGWAGAIYPFVKSTGVYRCPDDSQEGKFISYAENKNLVKQSVESLPAIPYTVALYELSTLNCDPSTGETSSTTGLSAPQNSIRHETVGSPFGLNFLAVDGHVKYLKPGQVSGGPNAVGAKTLPIGAYLETFTIK